MTDPWVTGARRRRTEQSERAAEEETQQRQAAAKRDADRQAADAAYKEMQRAVADAVPLLARFLDERGAAAQELIGAAGDRAYVCLGSENEGGGYYSVSFCKDGLVYEVGQRSGYGSKPVSQRRASVREAVEAFARDGAGYQNPEKVRAIVDWLTEKVDEYLP